MLFFLFGGGVKLNHLFSKGYRAFGAGGVGEWDYPPPFYFSPLYGTL